MSRSLHTIPVELVYRILDNLSYLEILLSCSDVCTKLNAILDTYRHFQVRNTLYTINLISYLEQKRTTLYLDENQLGRERAKPLAKALTRNKVRPYDYHFSYFNKTFVDYFQQTLITIDLRGREGQAYDCQTIGPEGARYFAEALQHNTVIQLKSLHLSSQSFLQTLTTLSFWHNTIRDEGVLYLANALKQNKVTHLL